MCIRDRYYRAHTPFTGRTAGWKAAIVLKYRLRMTWTEPWRSGPVRKSLIKRRIFPLALMFGVGLLFACVGRNAYGDPGAPTITQQPQGRSVLEGSNFTFSVTASGTAPLSYQWRFNGTNLASATSAQLAFTPVALSNAGLYQVV